MAHALSASSLRSDRMSPPAVALAILLHAAVALALWWMSLNRPQLPPTEDPIDITFEQPKPTEPPPPERVPQPPPPPVELGLRPPAPLTSDKPTQVPPAAEPSKEAPTPPPPPHQEAVAPPQLDPPQPTPAPTPTPSELAAPAGRVPPEQALAVPPPAPPKPTPPAPRPELRPSPLSTAPQRRPPAAAAREQPSPHRFVNPADAYNRARVADNYLWQIARKLEGYRYQANVNARQGLTVVRIVIARNGRLIDVNVARSSGVPEFDRGVVAGVRAGSPYTPLPPEIQGDSATFNLPLVSVNRQ